MSENTFNKAKFAQLLMTGISTAHLTQAELAESAGLSQSYLNRLFNKKNDSPPKASTVYQIANALGANQKFTDKFLVAAGYDPKKESANRKTAISKEQIRSTRVFNIISSAFFRCEVLKWDPISMDDLRSTGFDFGVKIEESEYIDQWFFEFFSGKKMEDTIKDYYSGLLYAGLKPKTKISIVVCDAAERDRLLTIAPALPCYLSIVLVDMDCGVVIEEKYVQTFLPLESELTEIDVLPCS